MTGSKMDSGDRNLARITPRSSASPEETAYGVGIDLTTTELGD